MERQDVLPGTLDLLILSALEGGARHGYGVMEAIWERSGELFRVEEGALYPALHRLEVKGLLSSEWGLSEANRRAKYYKLSPAGRKVLRVEKAEWKRVALGMGRFVES
jgi:PadR family transcriptional regulator, regulatory protein PadR